MSRSSMCIFSPQASAPKLCMNLLLTLATLPPITASLI